MITDKSLLFPLMGLTYNENDFLRLDLSIHNDQLPVFEGVEDMTAYISHSLVVADKKLAYGGYLEHRNLYQSDLFLSNGPVRDIHLGVDVWGSEMTPLYCPYNGVVCGLAYNDQELDYGYTLILRHSWDGTEFHTLYGHLSHHIMDLWNVGDDVQTGVELGFLGKPSENGGWSPHVHFQVMMDMGRNRSDYPGVCAREDLEYYRSNCPDPIGLVFV